MSQFKFELNQIVAIIASSESGIVIGRAQYATSENHYQIRYEAGNGQAVEAWWGESALTNEGFRDTVID